MLGSIVMFFGFIELESEFISPARQLKCGVKRKSEILAKEAKCYRVRKAKLRRLLP